MWRFLNNIPRAFRQQCHGPRASIGVHVEEGEQESQVQASLEICLHEKHGVKELQSDQGLLDNCTDTINCTKEEFVRDINPTKSHRSLFCGWNPRKEGFFSYFGVNQGDGTKKKKDEGRWWRSCRYDLCALLNRNHLFEILSVGSYYGWGSENKLRAKKRWLYRVLLSLSSGDSALHLIENKVPGVVHSALSEDRSQQDAKNLDVKIPEVVSAPVKEEDSEESIKSALKEFQEICKDYSSKSESLLGLAAAEDGNMTVAIQHLKKACLMGNISACFNVGLCYETGSGVPKQLERAVEYYERAAKHGHSLAMYNLGLIYLDVDSQREDSQKRGMLLIEEAAKVGLAEAQTQMGIFCMEQDNAGDAFNYFTAAANQNDCESQYFLALCYEQGLGVEEDMEKSAQYYSLAASSGHEGAMYNLAVYTELGLGGIVADPVASVDLYEKAAEAGHTRAHLRLQEFAAEKAGRQGQENERLLEQHDNSSSGSLRRSSSGSASLSSSVSSPNLIGHHTDVPSLFFQDTGCEEPYPFSFLSNSEAKSQRRSSVGFYIGEGSDIFGLKTLGWSLTLKRPEASSIKDLDTAITSSPLHGHFHKSHTSPNLSALVTCSM